MTDFTVAELPVGEPSVAVEKTSYVLGDTLRANCSAPLPLNISWQLNGYKVVSYEESFFLI